MLRTSVDDTRLWERAVVGTRLWRLGCGDSAVEPRLWRPGCGDPAVETPLEHSPAAVFGRGSFQPCARARGPQ